MSSRSAPAAGQPPAPNTPDLAQIDALVTEFFQCFDNRSGRVPSVGSMTQLFVETAVISQHRAGTFELYSPGAFAAPRVELLSNGTLVGFHEWEVDATTRLLGPIATRVSAYAKAGCLNGVQFTGEGTKVFQCVKLGSHWRIVALSWFDSTD
jgi:hypothetical protein